MKITVLGSGGWGTALAILLNNNISDDGIVTIWDHFPETLENIRKHRENTHFLPGVKIPENIALLDDLEEALSGAELVLSAVPAMGVHEISDAVARHADHLQAVISATKGFDIPGKRRVSELWKDALGDSFKDKYAVLSGPSHAEEVARKRLTAVTIASGDIKLARSLSEVFSNEYFRCYASDDVIGVELGGVLKNIMAIGAGIIDQMELGVNARSAYITRALYEMIRFGTEEGSRRDTFYGLSGIGDLIVTCTSDLSRNHYVGRELGKGRSVASIREGMKMVAEGVATTEIMQELATKKKIDMPITKVLYGIMYRGHSVKEGIVELMGRSLKDEIFY